MISAKRRKATNRIIKRRIKQIKIFSPVYINKALKQPHRLAKTPPFGCRRSNCRICRKGKVKNV